MADPRKFSGAADRVKAGLKEFLDCRVLVGGTGNERHPVGDENQMRPEYQLQVADTPWVWLECLLQIET
jgi:hypothetical protein